MSENLKRNYVELTGNVVKDGVLTEMRSGAKVLRFTLAVNDVTKADDGSWVDGECNFLKCYMWFTDETPPTLNKGDWISIEGRLKQSTWANELGHRKSEIKVCVTHLFIRESKPRG